MYDLWQSILTIMFILVFAFVFCGIGHTVGERIGHTIGKKMVQNKAAEAGVGRYVANETNGIVRFEWIKK